MTPAPIRILCIEDNAMNWRLVQRLLSQAGHELHWATDGLAGVQMALELKPDLILLDINLPDLSGFEVATKLRHLPDMADTLIVALTAKTLPVDRDTALVTGCDGFIPKPIDPFEFASQVEGYLRGKRDRLAQGQEQSALRQFTHQVVEHLETQLMEAQQANAKLLQAQAQAERRGGVRGRILALMQHLVFLREPREIVRLVLHRLREDLHLDSAVGYHAHESGAYFEGLRVGAAPGLDEALDPLLRTHPMMPCILGCPHAHPMTGDPLAAGDCWQPGLRLGLWRPTGHAACQPLHARDAGRSLWGLLALHRAQEPFDAFELEMVNLCGEILQVCVENAHQFNRLEQHGRALGDSYQRLDDAQRSLREAQEGQVRAERACRAALRRLEPSGLAEPALLSLHDLVREEVDLLRVQGHWPEALPLGLELAAARDRVFASAQPLAQVLRAALRRALAASPRGLRLSTAEEAGAWVLALATVGVAAGVRERAEGYAAESFQDLAELLAPSQGHLEEEDTAEGLRIRLRLPLA